MKWITTDYKGNKKVWYSENVIEKIKEIIKNVKCPCEYKGLDCWECSESGAKRVADKILELLNEVDNGNITK